MTNSNPAVPPVKPTQASDWEAVRTRLERAARATAAAAQSPERADAVFKERARALAAPVTPRDDFGVAGPGVTEAVLVRLGGQVYAIESNAIREAVDVPRITPLPGLPSTVRGLANVRSRIVPAFDIRPLLNLPVAADRAARETMLLMSHDGAEFGLLVDAVLGVKAIPAAQLRRDVPGLMTQYLLGVTDDGQILLDLNALVEALTTDGHDADF